MFNLCREQRIVLTTLEVKEVKFYINDDPGLKQISIHSSFIITDFFKCYFSTKNVLYVQEWIPKELKGT